MIEKMKKITVLLHNREKKKTLAKLQNLGLLHLDTKEAAVGEKYRKLQKKKQTYESLKSKIEKLALNYTKELKQFTNSDRILSDDNSSAFPSDVKTFHQRMLHLAKKFDTLEKEYLAKEELENDQGKLLPWGEFDWDKLERLEQNEIYFEFYITTQAVYESSNLDGEYFFPVSRDKDRIYLLRILPKHSGAKGHPYTEKGLNESGDKQDISFERIYLPKMSLSEIQKNLEILNAGIRKDEIYLARFHREEDRIQKEIDGISVLMDFESAKFSLENDAQSVVFAITGFLPVSQEGKIVPFLLEEGIAYQIEEPNSEDNVPIKLRNSRFAKAFEPITRIFALPKYMELDPTAFFAPFFALFFGLCLGDIGYGTILFVLASIAYFKVKKELQVIPLLLVFLSISTILSGILLNTFFGEAFFKIPESDFYILESGRELALFSAYTMEGKTIYPAMTLALVLGFVQLSFGVFLQAINLYRTNRSFLYAIKPLAVIGLIWGGTIIAVHRDFLALGFNRDFGIGIFPLGEWLVQIPIISGQILFYSGLVGFFLFNNPEKNFLIRPVFGIWEAYQFIIGFSGDFLSYVRLFALGLASGLLGNAFNQVAFMVLPDKDMASPLFALTLVILVLGHVLNIALSVLGSFVHPLRLTFVEFYKNMNFVGGGREFKPFTIAKES